ncbi:AI-2E family transporter [bacterium]|nr:AI-2E family transporter [bacterium]
MPQHRLEISFFLILFAVVALLAFLVFRPFLNILLLAGVFAVLLFPVHSAFLRWFGGGKSMAAFVTVFIAFIFLIIPIFFLGMQIFEQASAVYTKMQGNGSGYARVVESAIETPIRQVFPEFSFDAREYAGRAIGLVAENFGFFVSQTAYILLAITLLLFALFSFLRDGRAMLLSVRSVSPLEPQYNEEIAKKIQRTINTVVKGTLLIALIQGVFVGMGFYIFGIPNATLWGSIGGVASLIQGLGTSLVIVPGVIYLALAGNLAAALGLAIWGALIVGLIDNILISYFYGKESGVPPVFILFAVLGGLVSFGPLGFIFGPIILSLFVSMMHIYRILVLGKNESENDALAS